MSSSERYPGFELVLFHTAEEKKRYSEFKDGFHEEILPAQGFARERLLIDIREILSADQITEGSFAKLISTTIDLIGGSQFGHRNTEHGIHESKTKQSLAMLDGKTDIVYAFFYREHTDPQYNQPPTHEITDASLKKTPYILTLPEAEKAEALKNLDTLIMSEEVKFESFPNVSPKRPQLITQLIVPDSMRIPGLRIESIDYEVPVRSSGGGIKPLSQEEFKKYLNHEYRNILQPTTPSA